ncbi:hypothetical protein [Variovorax guangxiensis]|uniref:hypothetical protein n=1 Tax=Variovorax guangxiensis TaxID=1775474 RepID=UPI002856AB4F|nr:hypothetical protein [Variovorax guangxiensis]MDR6856068.1 hypothetical protein [Variovorax guangxiensis]
MVAIKNWMSNIEDATLLKEIVMPGSHDAGVWASPGSTGNVLVTNAFMPVASIAAQLGDIRAQAEAGARWFDIRMYKTPTRWMPWEKSLRPNKLDGHKMKLRAAHVPAFQEGAISKGILQSPGLGGYGASIEQILDQAISFVTLPGTRTEFLVIRFSHCPEPKKVLKEIKHYLEDRTKANRGNILQHISPGVASSLGNTPMSALRSKVALIFDESFQKYCADTNYSAWLFTYSKNIASKSDACCCGQFADSPDTQVVKNAAVQAATVHLGHGNNNGHLCFVYWQLTQRSLKQQFTGGGNIHANTTAPKTAANQGGGTHANTGDLMADLMNLSARGSRTNLFNASVPVNVISHDFVKNETSQQIVKANGSVHGSQIKGAWPLNW